MTPRQSVVLLAVILGNLLLLSCMSSSTPAISDAKNAILWTNNPASGPFSVVVKAAAWSDGYFLLNRKETCSNLDAQQTIIVGKANETHVQAVIDDLQSIIADRSWREIPQNSLAPDESYQEFEFIGSSQIATVRWGLLASRSNVVTERERILSYFMCLLNDESAAYSEEINRIVVSRILTASPTARRWLNEVQFNEFTSYPRGRMLNH